MNRRKKTIRYDSRCRRYSYFCKASFTVEASMVMPLLLGCIILLIFMNFYLHDLIVLNASGEELLYASGESDRLIQQEAETNTIVLRNVKLEKTENLVTKQVVWDKRYRIPLQEFISAIGGKPEVQLAGKMTSKSYSMSKVIRLTKERN